MKTFKEFANKQEINEQSKFDSSQIGTNFVDKNGRPKANTIILDTDTYATLDSGVLYIHTYDSSRNKWNSVGLYNKLAITILKGFL